MVPSTCYPAERASGSGAARGSAHSGFCPLPPRGRGRACSAPMWRRRVGRSLLVVVSVATATFAVAGASEAQVGSGEVRVVARRVDDGRVEFGLQERAGSEAWEATRFPSKRFFPVDAAVGRWLASSPLSVDSGEVRVVARRVDDGRVEFGLQERAGSEAWEARRFPSKRFFPVDAAVGRWLVSSPLSVGRVAAPAGAGAVACEGVRPPEFIHEAARASVCLPDAPGVTRFFANGGVDGFAASPHLFLHPDPSPFYPNTWLTAALWLEVGTVFEIHYYAPAEAADPILNDQPRTTGSRERFRVTKVGGQLHSPNTPCTLYRSCWFRMVRTWERFSVYGPPSETIPSTLIRTVREACFEVWPEIREEPELGAGPALGPGMYHFTFSKVLSIENC